MSTPGQKDTRDISRGPAERPVVTMALNKRPASHRDMLQAGDYLDHITGVPEHVAVPELRFPMDENNAWGDCVVAGVDHAIQTVCALYGVARTNWTPEQILAFYRTQNPDFDPNGDRSTNGPGSAADGGMSVADFLTHLVKVGELVGFAQVDVKDPDQLRAAIYVGAAVVTGEILDAQQMQTSQPWDAVGGDEEGGHCTSSVAFPNLNTVAVTWGTTVEMTDAFVVRQMDEAYLILVPRIAGKRLDGFPWELFGADYTSLTGRPFPGPSPAPTPTPPATNTVTGVNAKAWDELVKLAERHGFTGDADGVRDYLDWRFDPADRDHGEDVDAGRLSLS